MHISHCWRHVFGRTTYWKYHLMFRVTWRIFLVWNAGEVGNLFRKDELFIFSCVNNSTNYLEGDLLYINLYQMLQMVKWLEIWKGSAESEIVFDKTFDSMLTFFIKNLKMIGKIVFGGTLYRKVPITWNILLICFTPCYFLNGICRCF